jgi:hypothetical protein
MLASLRRTFTPSTVQAVCGYDLFVAVLLDILITLHADIGMESTLADLLASDCTSCAVVQDKSAYWTPALYFVRPDGTADVVNQVGGTLV